MTRLLVLLAFVLVPAALLAPGAPPARRACDTGIPEDRKAEPVQLDRVTDDERPPAWSGIVRTGFTELRFPPPSEKLKLR
jgi:hypothetical protein